MGLFPVVLIEKNIELIMLGWLSAASLQLFKLHSWYVSYIDERSVARDVAIL
jgi:hypothetical protein